jgi:predicted DNA-binding transcriptional regulator AlpA
MSLISIQEAANRVGVSRETIEAWAKQGLLSLHVAPRPHQLPPGTLGFLTVDQFVDDEELDHVAESMGWLHVAAEGWDGTEGE